MGARIPPSRRVPWRVSAYRTVLGRISYSLYLTHAVILLALLHLLDGRIPMSAIIALMWIVAVPVAALSYRWVELPAIGLGKRVASRFDEPRGTAVRAGVTVP